MGSKYWKGIKPWGKEVMDEQVLEYSHLPIDGGERQCQGCVAWLVWPFRLKNLDRAPHS